MLGIGVSLRHLRGTTAAVDAYKVAGFKPDLVFDFEQEYYRTGGTQTTFDSAMTLDRSSNATMVDSDGLLKWAPHNLVTYSDDVNTVWALAGLLSTADNLLIPSTVDSYHYIENRPASGVYDFTWEFEAKPEGYTFVRLFNQIIGVGVDIDLVNKTFSNKHAEIADPVITDSTDGYVHVSCEYVGLRTNKRLSLQPMPSALNTATFAGDGISGVRVRRLSMFRSDLGGMVNNPDRGDSYVPTTSAARYLPRRGHHVYNGAEWVNEGVLVEPSAGTNLITYSVPNSTDWVEIPATIASAPLITAPDGSNETVKISNVAVNDEQQVFFDPITPAAGTYTISVFFKSAGEGVSPQIRPKDEGVGSFFVNFNLDTGLVGNSGGPNFLDATMQDFGNGWYRCVVTSVFSNPSSGFSIVLSRNPDTDGEAFVDPSMTYVGDGSGFYAWGAQAEQASTPSSYVPTSGSTVTRAADDADSDNLTYDSSAMWFTLSGLQTFADEGAAGQEVLFDWRVDANNRITVTIDTDGAETGEITLTVVSGGTTWSVAQDYLSPGVNVPFNIAWRVTDTEINVAAGGTSATAVATTSIPDLSSASAAFDGNGVYSLFRHGIGDIGDSGIAGASA